MTRGGKRQGAGRPKGTGVFQEATVPMRIPQSLIQDVKSYVNHRGYKMPLFSCRVQAGFPSPAEDHIEARLDLNELLIKEPSATFFLKVSGESMRDAGIFPNDLLIVDRSIKAVHGKIVIAVVNNELTVKRLYQKNGVIKLMAENSDFVPIVITAESELHIWGVVTNVIHAV
ncbi:MAG: translesion error-prone DNA polymerase V autoproteolytic subunit [Alphaproteobacteria bacterium]|nr:translesion error-prone DNA polymerase V autoproteolytic subunit [Alphaproteobacteria bacterium]